MEHLHQRSLKKIGGFGCIRGKNHYTDQLVLVCGHNSPPWLTRGAHLPAKEPINEHSLGAWPPVGRTL